MLYSKLGHVERFCINSRSSIKFQTDIGKVGYESAPDSVDGPIADHQDQEEKCPQCGGSHAGLRPGDLMPDNAVLRRGIPGDKIKPDGSIAKSTFKDPAMSVDMATHRSPAQTLSALHLQGGQYVEFTVKEARTVFPGNEVVFACLPGNRYHCEVRGRKTDPKCNRFAEQMRSRLKRL